MRLPDFLRDDRLTYLKAKMGIPSDVYGAGTGVVIGPRLTDAEVADLVSGRGIEVNWDELTVLENGTFVYKNITRVLIYIRDIHPMGNADSEPRYHLTTCGAITSMRSAGRFSRYVVAQEPNGNFHVNVIQNGRSRAEQRRLAVCQSCLAALNFNGFGFHIRRPDRQTIVRAFTPSMFFEKYPQSPHAAFPNCRSDEPPLNDYPKDWPTISADAKQLAGWSCSGCRKSFDRRECRQWLHVHHRDGNRWNCHAENLQVLCIECHAAEPRHAHIRNSSKYREFKRSVC